MTPVSPAVRHRLLAIAAAVAAVAALSAIAFAPRAAAIPPGGPVENRNGAQVTIAERVVAAGGPVAFTGSGFAPGQVLWVKVDDGLVLPDHGLRPAPPAGTNHVPDSYLVVVADGGGEIAGSVDLSHTVAADLDAVGPGKHLLRFLGNSPQLYSIHADFLVTADTLPVPQVGTAVAHAGPGPDQPVPYLGADHLYDDIPALVAGSLVPYRLSGFTPDSVVSVKINDTMPAPGVSNGVWATIETDADGRADGVLELPTDVPGAYWLRLLQPGASIVAPYAVVPRDSRDISLVQGGLVRSDGTVGYATSNLLRAPADYWLTPASNGQTVRARVADGPLQQFTTHSGDDPGTGAVRGSLAAPSGLALGAHRVLFWVGFAAPADGPQAVFARTATLTATPPDPDADPSPQPDPQPTPDPDPSAPPAATPPAAAPSATAPARRLGVGCRLLARRTVVRCAVRVLRTDAATGRTVVRMSGAGVSNLSRVRRGTGLIVLTGRVPVRARAFVRGRARAGVPVRLRIQSESVTRSVLVRAR